MWCSASCRIWPASSSAFIAGTAIFLMITEWPAIAIATSFLRSLSRLHSARMASATALWSMIVPSTIVWGTSGCMPKAVSAIPDRVRLSWTALMLLEPMSSPMQFFAMELREVGEQELPTSTLAYMVGHCDQAPQILWINRIFPLSNKIVTTARSP